ncbi:MAG: exosome non-catalytic core subunit rrp40 [Trizodia sp. TS-e1964]|nr:MAG: exosome non-catalytic core subunit rrp40 [Trizodia sp. TS-e1964]
MNAPSFIFPGESIANSLLPLPANPSTPLKLGPGMRLLPPATITATVAGVVCIDARKNAVWTDHNSGRYTPTPGDAVLATVHHSSSDAFYCRLTPATPLASLPHLAFEGASKKTRPTLPAGALVYARVATALKHMDPELECVNPATGKADGLGPLKGGMVFDISGGMARRLMMGSPGEQGGVVVLEELAARLPFEVAVGRNGRVWVSSASLSATLAVGRAIQETDRGRLGADEQRRLVKRLLKGV